MLALEPIDRLPLRAAQVTPHPIHPLRRAEQRLDHVLVKIPVEKPEVGEAAAEPHRRTEKERRAEQIVEGRQRSRQAHEELIERNPRRPVMRYFGVDEYELLDTLRIRERQIARERAPRILRNHAVAFEPEALSERQECPPLPWEAE